MTLNGRRRRFDRSATGRKKNMRGMVGIAIGVVIVALGLAGLGAALAQMMSHANPNGTLISVGGLGVFAVACLFVLAMAR
jgi:putative exporter of polyketide antibiotics